MKTGRREDGKTGSRAGVAFVALLLLPVFPSSRLPAQSSPAIRAAIQLASDGRGDSARKVLDSELTRMRPGDSTWVEALYWRARLAPAGEAADRDLRRIAIEFGNSSWADDALLQLAQLAIAAGNPAAALDYTARLRTDYPGSELRPKAALWGARAAFDVGEPRTACALLDTARAEGASDIEFVNQVSFYRERCTATALAAPRPRPARTDSMTGRPPIGEPVDSVSVSRKPVIGSTGDCAVSTRGVFEVQVAAARTDAKARDIARRLEAVGLCARVVPAADNVHRVRLGPFRTGAAADSAADAARRLVGGSPFVVRLP